MVVVGVEDGEAAHWFVWLPLPRLGGRGTRSGDAAGSSRFWGWLPCVARVCVACPLNTLSQWPNQKELAVALLRGLSCGAF